LTFRFIIFALVQMKRLLLTAVLGCLLIPQLAHAQSRRGRRATPIAMGATFGFKLGGSFSNITGTDTKIADFGSTAISYNSKIGLVAGGLANYRFTPELSAQVEALYTNRGTVRKLTYANGVRRDEKITLTYVDVPLLFKFNAKIFYVEIGPVGSFLLSYNSKIEETGNGGTSNPVDLIKPDSFNSIDTGGAIGAGVEVPNGTFFGVRYIKGFGSIGTSTGTFAGRTLENSSVQVTGGYIFNHTARRGRR
jgi:Outer membrane protein beta-barrel domain